jgi:hypothetical protein
MRARVSSHVNEFDGFACAQQRGFGDGIGFAGQRDDATVVIGIHLMIEHPHAGNLAHGLNQRFNFCRVAAFAEIWHTLNQSFHEKVTAASIKLD